MYVQVRTIDCKTSIFVTVSKLTTVDEFRAKIQEALNVEPVNQRLFYRGKQLENGYKLFDYNINLNDVVQLMIKGTKPPSTSEQEKTAYSAKGDVKTSKYFKVGDNVDALDCAYGAWFEGVIEGILEEGKDGKNEGSDENGIKSEVSLGGELIYCVRIDGGNVRNTLDHIRPVSKYQYKFSELSVGDTVLVNYNIEMPNEKGYWYDYCIDRLEESKDDRRMWGTLFIGKDRIPLRNVELKFTTVLKIESVHSVTMNVIKEETCPVVVKESPVCESESVCPRCKNKPSIRCKDCGCHVCGLKDEPESQILCDECDMAYHLKCLNPPLQAIPDVNEWYCPSCKNDENEIVKAGEKLKESKKKAKMASKQSKGNRDWGKGMACVGRTTVCTLVPPNHFGPIPGVEVGTTWKFRLQVSESGVHRPHVAGIHGRDSEGAYSLVLSGGYEDDIDDGESFVYTGSGGRDLSGNKRTAEQSCDQTLTRMNKALALNCNAPINVAGNKAEDWKSGKPIRVVRNYKLAKHSKYAPDEGNRYDGIYKVVKYYPQKGKSGYVVWRYVLRRDDPTPAPWTEEGKKHMESLGLTMIYPEGYLEVMASKENQDVAVEKGIKRQSEDLGASPSSSKKKKAVAYELDSGIRDLIQNDVSNNKLWNTCKDSLSNGKQKFLSIVSETFMCICCQELVLEPVTTGCGHNFCRPCLKRAFKAEVYTCPYCRCELGEKFQMEINRCLADVLLKLFPGYNAGR
ncbi:E3 ubiquitin-protein ligase UHRF1 [Anabrus simplex]|uniref:E3 ubiquitin-protein ligase UHRF1 n=1 Tax=Anabrus simplex TaxID=316456 RepID=UPI0035A2783D